MKKLFVIAFLFVLFIFILARAVDQTEAGIKSHVPAAVNSVAPDDEGTEMMNYLDVSTLPVTDW